MSPSYSSSFAVPSFIHVLFIRHHQHYRSGYFFLSILLQSGGRETENYTYPAAHFYFVLPYIFSARINEVSMVTSVTWHLVPVEGLCHAVFSPKPFLSSCFSTGWVHLALCQSHFLLALHYIKLHKNNYILNQLVLSCTF